MCIVKSWALEDAMDWQQISQWTTGKVFLHLPKGKTIPLAEVIGRAFSREVFWTHGHSSFASSVLAPTLLLVVYLVAISCSDHVAWQLPSNNKKNMARWRGNLLFLTSIRPVCYVIIVTCLVVVPINTLFSFQLPDFGWLGWVDDFVMSWGRWKNEIPV